MKTSEDCSANGNNEKVAEAALESCEDGPQESILETDSVNTCENHDSKEAEAPSEEIDDGKAGGKRKLQIQGKWRGVDPVVFFQDEDVVNSVKNFYGILDSFQLSGHLVTRNSETTRVKRIYYVSESVKELLELNFKVGQLLKITSIGLKMFVSISAYAFGLSCVVLQQYVYLLECTLPPHGSHSLYEFIPACREL